MTRRLLALRGLRHYWRLNAVTLAGAGIGAAVICGAVIIGDSFQGTLRDRALRRLGRIAFALRADGMVRRELPAEMAEILGTGSRTAHGGAVRVTGLLYAHGTAHRPTSWAAGPVRRHRVEVYGIEADGAGLFPEQAEVLSQLGERDAAVSASLARDLGLRPGDALIIEAARPADAPAKSLFLHRDPDRATAAFRVSVRSVVDGHAGFFSLKHTDYSPPNVFVRRRFLERRLDCRGLVNLVLVEEGPSAQEVEKALAGSARLADYGLRMVREATPDGALQIEARRLVIPGGVIPVLDQAAASLGGSILPISFYLANEIALERAPAPGKRRSTPYSVIAAVAAPLLDPPLHLLDGRQLRRPPNNDEILLNQWTADQLGARVGDRVRLEYYVTMADETLQTAEVRLRVAGIVAMTSPLEDASLVPEYRGITDAEDMADWNPPFPIDLSRITPADEAYWNRWRTTPKAFLSAERIRWMWTPRLPDGPRLAGNDWITTVRVRPGRGTSTTQFAEKFEKEACRRLAAIPLALRMRPVRQEALAAAKGSSDFRGLFLGLGIFLVAAAGGFAALAVRLNLTRRAREVGLLLTVGWTQHAVRRLILAEAAVLTVLAGAVGAVGGVVYARLLLTGMTRHWRSIMGMLPALDLHVVWLHVVIAALAGAILAMAAGAPAVSGLVRRLPVDLLTGWRVLERRSAVQAGERGGRLRRSEVPGGVLLVVGVLLVGGGVRGVVAPLAAFFSAGSCLLAGLILLVGAALRPARGQVGAGLSRVRLAWRANSVSRTRSLLVLGIPACGVFLLVAVASGYRQVDPESFGKQDGPAGGYDLHVTAELPMRVPLEQELQKRCSDEERMLLKSATIVSCRLSAGDAASCLNIQMPVVPRVLGVPSRFIQRGGFAFRALDPQRLKAAGGKPWNMLLLPDDDGVIPAFADADSARWILHKKLGDLIPAPTSTGRIVHLRLVGLLEPGILAGELVVGESAFLRYFSQDSGFRVFFVDAPADSLGPLTQLLVRHAGDFGIEVEPTRDILARLFSVQNAYIGAFATLGGLGLTLGMLGLFLMLLREAEERRAEFGLLLAVGFTRKTVAAVLGMQIVGLLVSGVCIGLASGLGGVGPYFVTAGLPMPWRLLVWVTAGILLVGAVSVIVGAAVATSGRLVSALRRE